MAPSDRTLVDTLEETVSSIFHSGDRDTLSVKKVRDKAEGELGVEQGFFLQPKWKDRSKQIIKEYVEVLAEREEAGEPTLVQPESKKKATPAPKKVTSPIRKRTQKVPPAEKSRSRKRQKKKETPGQEGSDEQSSESGLSYSDFSEVTTTEKISRRSAKPPVKGQATKRKRADTAEENESEDLDEDSFGDDDENSDAKPSPKRKAAPKPLVKAPTTSKAKSKKAKLRSPGSAEESSALTTPSDSEEETKSPPRKKGKPSPRPVAESDDELAPSKISTDSPEPTKGQVEAEAKASDSESEMSVVVDEPPKHKRKQKAPSSTKVSKPKASKVHTTISPTDEQLKVLQAQLRKCGVRKIWQFELKQFGDDGKAKIRYLKDMLKDIGMTGRFSEARAKEIQEMRELQADLEAVKEGEKSWGLESGRRARSTVKKNMKISSEDEDEDEDSNKVAKDAGESESEEAPSGRVRRVNQDLAFLGDEEESD